MAARKKNSGPWKKIQAELVETRKKLEEAEKDIASMVEERKELLGRLGKADGRLAILEPLHRTHGQEMDERIASEQKALRALGIAAAELSQYEVELRVERQVSELHRTSLKAAVAVSPEDVKARLLANASVRK